jgi:hypothetical protein
MLVAVTLASLPLLFIQGAVTSVLVLYAVTLLLILFLLLFLLALLDVCRPFLLVLDPIFRTREHESPAQAFVLRMPEV